MDVPFSMVPSRAYGDRRLKPCEVYILGAIGCYVGTTKTCFPSNASIQKMTGLAKITIKQATSKLEKYGYLKKEQRFRKDGGFSSNKLKIIFGEETMCIPDEEDDTEDDLEHTRLVLETIPVGMPPHTSINITRQTNKRDTYVSHISESSKKSFSEKIDDQWEPSEDLLEDGMKHSIKIGNPIDHQEAYKIALTMRDWLLDTRTKSKNLKARFRNFITRSASDSYQQKGKTWISNSSEKSKKIDKAYDNILKKIESYESKGENKNDNDNFKRIAFFT